MIKRGRKSGAELAIVSPITDHRPPVPTGMPEAQADIWRQVTNRLPYDWFRAEHLPVLRAYCQRVATAQTIASSIETFEPKWLAEEGGPERLDLLAKMLDREHRAMVMLARSMRFTHQSQYDRSVAAKHHRDAPQRLPWEPIP